MIRAWRHTAPLLTLAAFIASGASAAEAYRDRQPQDEVIYFVLPDRFENGDASNDRGGIQGGRLQHGFDPASKGFYHGGDLKGLTARLDYIRSLGATAIWLTPLFKNKPVQGGRGEESAGYHGYWITDFTRVDPHLGDDAELRAFIAAAHERDMKVYFDIVANHTADVIAYRECPAARCPYRSRADRAYTPYLPRGEEHIKVPAWLNEVGLYHNRGDSTFEGESSEHGDFVGLDDLMTEHPRVVQGFIDIYGGWIDRYRIDGYRIDTAKHVDAAFWRAFVPAMLARARANGIENFHLFGEVSTESTDSALLARSTRVAKLPAVLDFAFANAVRAVIADARGTDVLERLFAGDSLYAGGEATALQLPTFVSNHDIGRFAWFVRKARPRASDDEISKRVVLAHAMLFTLRGVPVIYYGDEQGFIGSGGDQDARQDMFASQTETYRTQPRRGSSTTHFDRQHPLYRAIADLASLRQTHAALRRGRQIVRYSSEAPGLFVVSRIDPESKQEIVVAFNTSVERLTANVEVAPDARHFTSLRGSCSPAPIARGSYRVTLPPLDFMVCAVDAPR